MKKRNLFQFKLLIMLMMLCSMSFTLNAQAERPLVGPIVAVTTAEQGQILLHDLGGDTLETRAIDFGVGELQVWDFSPDGCRVLFTLDRSENGLPTLYSAKLDGSDLQAMVSYTELAADTWGIWEPDWSAVGPDGLDRIAFTMIRDQPQTSGRVERVYHIAYVPGTGGTPEFYSVTGREFSPQYSADGAWLAYVSYDKRIAGADPQSTAVPTQEPPAGAANPPAAGDLPTLEEADIWIVGADGQNKRQVTAFSVGSVRHPRWSPDGDLIGFVYSPTASNDTLWMIGSQAGAQPTQLSYLWNLTLDHTWLPDTSAMLASVRDFRGITQNRLWRIPLVGNADNDATLYLSDESFEYTDYPRFSADGRYLAFRNAYTLVIVDTQFNTWSRLDEEQPGNTPPVWSPAGFEGELNCE